MLSTKDCCLKKNIARYFLIFFVMCFVFCSCSHDLISDSISESADDLYKKSKAEVVAHKYKDAVANLEKIEQFYPLSPNIPDVRILTAFAQYENKQYEDALSAIELFLYQFPTHKEVDYLLYLKAMCYYQQIVYVGCDQHTTLQTLEALKDLLQRFPQSKYAEDAKLKYQYAFNVLAGKEMDVGRFYAYNKNYVAAINRFKFVLINYQNSDSEPEALFRLIELHATLHLNDAVNEYYKLLEKKYGSNNWCNKAKILLRKK